MPALDPHLEADALRRARAIARRWPHRDPDECRLDLNDWLRAASLERYGFRAILHGGRPALLIRRRLVPLH
ncbi:MAG: hypothetical protein K9L70_07965 [Thiohalocapsa sp.]|nr:hypothetical protein [Thiohalocapsa sp.]MCF7991571.1 hypothetical protein [Thiohalocapsa sp.]